MVDLEYDDGEVGSHRRHTSCEGVVQVEALGIPIAREREDEDWMLVLTLCYGPPQGVEEEQDWVLVDHHLGLTLGA
jgi:hypothetical protein